MLNTLNEPFNGTDPKRYSTMHTLWRAMNHCLRPSLLSIALLALVACSSPVIAPRGAPVPPQVCSAGSEVSDSVFLIGDAGDPKLPPAGSEDLVDPVLLAMHGDVKTSVAKLGKTGVTTIFLGDNVYWDGLPVEGAPQRRERERKLEAQIAASAPAPAIFVMGNHDWHIEGPEGWDRVMAQRRFLKGFAPRVAMHPPAGCAGPDRVDVGEHLRFVFIDPIGWRHAFEQPEDHQAVCSGRDPLEAYYDMGAEFEHTDGRHVGLALHHPLITAGPHGGHYTWKQHIFPLTDFWPWAWFPLPVIGSAYPISRQLGVTGTDVASNVYTRDVSAIYRATRPRVPEFFVGGHEHSLQVHRDVIGAYYLVSGAGSASKIDRVEDQKLDSVMVAAAKPGYMRLDVLADGSLELTVTAVDGDGETETLMRHCLAEGPAKEWRRPAPTYER